MKDFNTDDICNGTVSSEVMFESEVTNCSAAKTDIESKDEPEEINIESEKSDATVSNDGISETEITDNDSQDESEETDKTETTWQQFAVGCTTFVDEFLDFFKCARTYNLNHVNNNAGVISRAESENRVVKILSFFAVFMTVYICIMIAILISLMKSPEKYPLQIFDNDSDNLPALQKLVVIFDDGNAFFMVMNKSFELEIVDTHNFNYDKCGFHAYDQIDHIQTLVGRPGQNNFMHDSRFNSRNISG